MEIKEGNSVNKINKDNQAAPIAFLMLVYMLAIVFAPNWFIFARLTALAAIGIPGLIIITRMDQNG
jgi:hypothetical protein